MPIPSQVPPGINFEQKKIRENSTYYYAVSLGGGAMLFATKQQ